MTEQEIRDLEAQLDKLRQEHRVAEHGLILQQQAQMKALRAEQQEAHRSLYARVVAARKELAALRKAAA